MRLALIVEYEGTSYSGFQYQTNAPSIQAELERAISRLTGESVRVKGAGRTDAGVHAKGQVVAFDTASEHTPETFVKALNFYLPEDIAVKAAYRVGEGFDPRRHAVSRRYRYTIVNSPTPSPLMRRWACLIAEPLNVEAMRDAARLFEGEHDFARFSGPLARPGASHVVSLSNPTVRFVFEASVSGSGEKLAFDVAGNAFLPHQVRRMAGALVELGRGRLAPGDLTNMLDGRDAETVAPALPPQGLCLLEVRYEDFPPT
ncbi:MAG: tRNA pseudouridine(38-40) synthase TruA [Chloroflexi bacterium]|nr:tRNA pseudouridine(38-40) synthase TruA [Chloroflexota bacterium]